MAIDRTLFSDEARRVSFIRKAKMVIIAGGITGIVIGGFIAHQLSHVFSKENVVVTKLVNPLTQDKE